MTAHAIHPRALGRVPALALVASAVAAAPGCTCGSKGATPGDAAPPPPTSAAEGGTAPTAEEPARLSAPIAAARLSAGAVVAAGLAVAAKSVVATRLEADGRTAWSKPVLGGVTWTGDAELRVHAAGDGAAIVWRGTRDGKRVKKLVFLGADGVVRGEPIDIGGASCATADQVAWIERGETGASRVRGRRHVSGTVEDLLAVHKDREALLVCGERRVYALGEGEEDAELVAPGDAGPWKVLAERDYAGDDELREHLEYAAGDDLGILRLTQGGAVHFRELRQGALGAWRRVSVGIPREDDVVAVEATGAFAVVVYTRDELEACDAESHGLSVHALRFDRKSGEGTHMDLAPATCGRELGPFWAGRAGERVVVSWGDRVGARPKSNPGMDGLTARVVSAEGASEPKRIERAADALAEAGCDAAACTFVALARAKGEPGIPNALTLLRVP